MGSSPDRRRRKSQSQSRKRQIREDMRRRQGIGVIREPAFRVPGSRMHVDENGYFVNGPYIDFDEYWSRKRSSERVNWKEEGF